MAKGPIKVRLGPDAEPYDLITSTAKVEEAITLPPNSVLDAGVAKFRECAGLHWPAGRSAGGDDLKLASFDHRNPYQLRVTLAMVYMAMRDAEKLGDT